jgi:SAM-dependent methyltransferase
VTHPDAERWNARYTADGESWLKDQPRQLLLDYAHQLPKRGLALDTAAGVANNGTYLARHGLHVITLDISKTALQLALQRASKESLPLSAAVYDLSHLWLPMNYFDVIVNFHFLERATFPVFRQALKPNGLIIFETFLRSNDDASAPNYYLEPGELLGAFSEFENLHWLESTIPGTTKVTAQLVARKPNTIE